MALQDQTGHTISFESDGSSHCTCGWRSSRSIAEEQQYVSVIVHDPAKRRSVQVFRDTVEEALVAAAFAWHRD